MSSTSSKYINIKQALLEKNEDKENKISQLKHNTVTKQPQQGKKNKNKNKNKKQVNPFMMSLVPNSKPLKNFAGGQSPDVKYPNLVPIKSPGYNLTKRVMADIYVKSLNQTIFHVWLDCLYNPDVNIQQIYTGLKPVFGSLDEGTLPQRYIYILASQLSPDEPPKPAGSCFIILSKPTIKKKVGSDSPSVLERLIMDRRLHIMTVDIAMVRARVKDEVVLIMSQGHLQILDETPLKFIMSAAGFEYKKPSKQSNVTVREEPKQPQAAATSGLNLESREVEEVVCIGSISESIQESRQSNNQPVDARVRAAKLEQRLREFISSSKPTNDINIQPESIDLTQDTSEDEANEPVDGIEVIPGPSRGISPKSDNVEKITNNHNNVARKFIPVTAQTLSQALKIMEKFELERRAVAVVFDSYFLCENLSMDLITTRYRPIFGDIRDDQVLIRTNMTKLLESLEEAKQITNVNQAYIIGEKGLSDTEINRRAADKGIFCCPMTMGCVVNNLKRGIFLMSDNVLLGNYNPTIGGNNNRTDGDNIKKSIQHRANDNNPKRSSPEDSSCNNKDIKPNQKKQPKAQQVMVNNNNNNNNNNKINAKPPLAPAEPESRSKKKQRNRIAATLNNNLEIKEDPPANKNKPKSTVNNKKPAASISSTTSDVTVDKELWRTLTMSGNTVIRVDNLPAKLTVQALNLMLGTYTLKSSQIVAARSANGNQKANVQLMDTRIILYNVNQDIQRIMSKNSCKTVYDSILDIKMSDFKELKQFIASRKDNLLKLDTDIGLPINRIGYGNQKG